MATPVILESIDAVKGLSYKDEVTEMGNGEKSNGDPAMVAFEVRGKRLGQKNETQRDERAGKASGTLSFGDLWRVSSQGSSRNGAGLWC